MYILWNSAFDHSLSLSRFFNSIVADLNEKNGIPTGKKMLEARVGHGFDKPTVKATKFI